MTSQQPNPGAADGQAHAAAHPDDGPLSRSLRKIDDGIGFGEQVVLFGLLCVVVLTATAQAVASKAFQHSFLWSFEIIRGGVFAIAMIGAAYATQQQRNLAMDLVSRRLGSKARLVLSIVLRIFVIVIAAVFMLAGEHLRKKVALETESHLVPMWVVAAMIPLGSFLIIVHSFIQLIIDADYLVRGKQAPERERVH